jgi:hypothetical protein
VTPRQIEQPAVVIHTTDHAGFADEGPQLVEVVAVNGGLEQLQPT